MAKLVPEQTQVIVQVQLPAPDWEAVPEQVLMQVIFHILAI